MENSFQPIVSPSTRTLILGSAPSTTSLKKREYYGHTGNRFWPLFSAFYQVPFPMPYADRCQQLLAKKLGLWDVYRSFNRIGSSDNAFTKTEYNDLKQFTINKHLSLFIINGKKAASEISKQLILQDKLLLVCPSTSGANNAQTIFRQKQWFLAYKIHEQINHGPLDNYLVYFGHSSDLKRKVYQLRKEVFVEEQQVNEADEFDLRDQQPDTDYFLVCTLENEPVATIRYQMLSNQIIQPDRFCVKKAYRMKKIGTDLLKIYELYAQFQGFSKSVLSAETTALPFYQKMGYSTNGLPYIEDGILCQQVTKSLHLL
ncbi:DNA-deoxyinosine glycosylase [Enterococcus camelliae]|uniref:DNA-deoxyinosine glycosylase n=1 Tax=Enterococcus camelliae TaxID=453959 RepID=A0ABW5TGG2_9ENTE